MSNVIAAMGRNIASFIGTAKLAAIGKTNSLVSTIKDKSIVLTGEKKVDSAEASGQAGWTFTALIGDNTYQTGVDCLSRALLDNGLTLEALKLSDSYTPSKLMLDKLEAGWKRQVKKAEIRKAEETAKREALALEAAKLEAEEGTKLSEAPALEAPKSSKRGK